ncbi:hypothetical protein PV703_12890 [Streptomyces sp. ME01-24h]|nr:hypothetical protein [Streptomyces sp. ME01-24h]
MHDRTIEPAACLSEAAELIREFNHASRPSGPGWEFPGHAYDALGSLARLVGMLPQTIEQAIRPVRHTYEHGRVAVDGGGDPDQTMARMLNTQDRAQEHARRLGAAVDEMHSATSPLGVGLEGVPTDEHDDQEDDEPAACRRCRKPFDGADSRLDGAAQYGITPRCRWCVDNCHEGSAEHVCVICDPARYGGEAR